MVSYARAAIQDMAISPAQSTCDPVPEAMLAQFAARRMSCKTAPGEHFRALLGCLVASVCLCLWLCLFMRGCTARIPYDTLHRISFASHASAPKTGTSGSACVAEPQMVAKPTKSAPRAPFSWRVAAFSSDSRAPARDGHTTRGLPGTDPDARRWVELAQKLQNRSAQVGSLCSFQAKAGEEATQYIDKTATAATTGRQVLRSYTVWIPSGEVAEDILQVIRKVKDLGPTTSMQSAKTADRHSGKRGAVTNSVQSCSW